MTDWLLALGVWAIALQMIAEAWLYRRTTPAPPAAPPARPRRLEREEPPYSPEGWGPPDSEVVSTEGDDYLARMKRPRPQDET